MLKSVCTAFCMQKYSSIIHDFLVKITKSGGFLEYETYVAENFYEEDYKTLTLHTVHMMLIHIKVLELYKMPISDRFRNV